MGRTRTSGLVRAEVEVRFPENVDFTALNSRIESHIDRIALDVAHEARSSTAFKDRTGNLRKSIKVLRRKDADGETAHIVAATSPHSHLVEFGTQGPRKATKSKKMPLDGIYDGKGRLMFAEVVGPMPASPFLRPALEKVIAREAASVMTGGGD
jgi:HK97 gp10 family phage protein